MVNPPFKSFQQLQVCAYSRVIHDPPSPTLKNVINILFYMNLFLKYFDCAARTDTWAKICSPVDDTHIRSGFVNCRQMGVAPFLTLQ